MTIPFTCPHCGARTNIDEKYAGTSGPCLQCGQTVTIPPGTGAAVRAEVLRDPHSATPQAPQKSNTLMWVLIAAGVTVPMLCCVIGILGALLLPAVQAAREAARRSVCANNLKQIGLALHHYHEVNGCFPPPYLADENGKPMHSWRVLILPYVERRDLYDRYDFDEPWNGPNNSQLASEMPGVYRCPSDTASPGETTTSYVAVVGPGLLFDPAASVRITDVSDGLSNTIAVVESAGPLGVGVHWMSPDDLSMDAMNPAINGTPGPAIASEHMHGANVLFADGSVSLMPNDTDQQAIQEMLTIGEGASVAP